MTNDPTPANDVLSDDSLERASLLPAGDLERTAVETALESASPDRCAVWDALLAEADALRSELGDVQVPVGLESRLAQLPDQPTARARPRWWFAAAAAAAVLIAAVVISFGVLRGDPIDGVLGELARLAAAEHVHDRHLTLTTYDVREFETVIGAELNRDVSLPALPPGLTLLGGRKCALAGHPIAYSLWEGVDRRSMSLFQFSAQDHGLPQDLARTRIDVPRSSDLPVHRHGPNGEHIAGAPDVPATTTNDAGDRGGNLSALVWIENGRGCMLVVDEPQQLPEALLDGLQ